MNQTEKEQAKYEKTWRDRNYRLTSPGEKSVPMFMEYEPELGTLIDFGCGTGRATKKLQERGFDVLGVDIAENAPDTGIPFEKACIWETPFKAKWAYCCDVLEHIPTDRIDDTLANMQTDNAFLRVHLHEDKFGKRVNEVLHMTVRPHEWWLEKISKYWNVVDHHNNGITSTFYCIGVKNETST